MSLDLDFRCFKGFQQTLDIDLYVWKYKMVSIAQKMALTLVPIGLIFPSRLLEIQLLSFMLSRFTSISSATSKNDP